MPHRAIPVRNRSNARALRNTMTEAEKRIWFRLRAHRLNGASFGRRMPIGTYIVDFVCFDEESQGFSVLRFWNHDVLTNTDGVIEKIDETLRASSPPSLTFPRKGGGNSSAQEAG